MSASVTDLDHYSGRGGRVYPLWRDATARDANMPVSVLALLSEAVGRLVSPEDVMAYLAGVMAHPAFTARFAEDLRQPGLRLPLTADRDLFDEAVSLGRRVIWLHSYGERFADPAGGRPKGAPRKAGGPTVPAGGGIPGAPEPLPDDLRYDAPARRLHVGRGFVDNVSPAVWTYEVSGKPIVRQWFASRRRDRAKPIIGDRRPPSPLDGIQPDHWLPEYTGDLIDLLHVLTLLTEIEAAQADLLDAILAGPLIDRETLTGAPSGSGEAAGPAGNGAADAAGSAR